MIHLPRLFIPAALLYQGDLTPRARGLLKECARITADCRSREVQGLCREAEKLHDQGDLIDCAVLSVHLGDRCLAAGRLGPARERYEQARGTFARHDYKPEQRHNTAVATYALGLVDQFLGQEEAASSLYDEARGLFSDAQDHWQRTGNVPMGRRCEDTIQLVDKLVEQIAEVLLEGGTTALPHLLRQREAMARAGKAQLDSDTEVDEDEDGTEYEEEMFGIFMRDAEGKVWMFFPRKRIIPEDEP
jgi:tetratricopeptide (TPR) repeat protein